MVISTQLKNLGQIGSYPQVGEKKGLKPPPRFRLVLCYLFERLCLRTFKFFGASGDHHQKATRLFELKNSVLFVFTKSQPKKSNKNSNRFIFVYQIFPKKFFRQNALPWRKKSIHDLRGTRSTLEGQDLSVGTGGQPEGKGSWFWVEKMDWNKQQFWDTHTIHVWYIYLHLVDVYGKCW